MTDAAQRVAIETAPQRASSDATVNSGTLALNPDSGAPGKVEVYVFGVIDSNTTVSGFAFSSDAATVYTGGLSWSPSTTNSNYALSVVFIFVPNTTPSLTPTSINYTGTSLLYTKTWSSQVGTTAMQKQAMTIPYTSAASTTYNFTVKFGNGTSHDPQIVVTPITN